MSPYNNIKAALIISVFMGLSAYIGAAVSQDKTTDFYGEIKDGEHPEGYREYVQMGCWQCHGFQGQGAGSPPLTAPLMPYEGFAHQVRQPRNVMPAYSPDILDESVMRAIYAYLQSQPPAPEVKEIPLLSGK